MSKTMIDDVIMLYLTASDCGICRDLRGDGILGNGRDYMNFDKLHGLLHDGIAFWNVHSRIRDGKLNSITDISKIWYLEPTEEERKNGINERIIQEKCFKFENKVRVMLLEMELKIPIKQEQKLPYQVKKTRAIETYTIVKNDSSEFISWDDWLKKQIPEKIQNFTGSYAPQAIVVKKIDWEKSLKDGSSFHAMTDRGRIGKNGNDWGLIRDQRMIQQIGMRVDQILQELREGTYKFEAIEDIKEGDVPEKNVKKKPERKVTFQTSGKERYIYYDDPE
jgi:hypothetical protein